MVRLVDTRHQNLDNRFSFWDTVRGVYISFYDDVAWDEWEDFSESYNADTSSFYGKNKDIFDIDRFKCLCPEWVFEPYKDEDMKPL